MFAVHDVLPCPQARLPVLPLACYTVTDVLTPWVTARVAVVCSHLLLAALLACIQTYYERLQAEAEQQPEAKNSEVCSGKFQESKWPAEEQGDVVAPGLKNQSTHPQCSSPGSQRLPRKVMLLVLCQAGSSVTTPSILLPGICSECGLRLV